MVEQEEAKFPSLLPMTRGKAGAPSVVAATFRLTACTRSLSTEGADWGALNKECSSSPIFLSFASNSCFRARISDFNQLFSSCKKKDANYIKKQLTKYVK